MIAPNKLQLTGSLYGGPLTVLPSKISVKIIDPQRLDDDDDEEEEDNGWYDGMDPLLVQR